MKLWQYEQSLPGQLVKIKLIILEFLLALFEINLTYLNLFHIGICDVNMITDKRDSKIFGEPVFFTQ